MEQNHELSDRLSRFEHAVNDNSLHQITSFVDPRVPPVMFLELAFATPVANHGTKVCVKWISPSDNTVDHYEIWISGHQQINTSFQHIVSVKDSPAFFWVSPDQDDVGMTIVVRTVLKNGLKTALDASPSCTAQIYL